MRPGDKKQHQQKKKKALYSGNGQPAGELDWERDTQASRGRAPPAHPAHPHGEEEAGAGSRDVRSLLAGNEALAPPPRLLPRETSRAPPSFLSATAMVGLLLLASAPSRRLGALPPGLSAACSGLSGSPWLSVACGAGWPTWVWSEEPGAACSDRSSDRLDTRARAVTSTMLSVPGGKFPFASTVWAGKRCRPFV